MTITKKIIDILLISFFYLVTHIACFAASSNIEGIQIYQKNLNLTEEHKKKLADAIVRYHNADNMWDVIRSEFILSHYEKNPKVQNQIEWFLNNQDYLIRTAQRAAPYLYFISQQVKKRHLPAEVILLPMIESAYNPFNYSSAGAAGIWQLMPGTASGFGVKQNWWYDGRRDVVASTKAALDYLVYLGGFFDGNWLLAIAAYDTGEGNILSAIRRNTRNGLSTDFWSLPVAQETRDYIPRLLALATIIAHPEIYKIDFPPVSNAPYLAQVDVGRQIDLKQAAFLAGISLTQFKKLNPGYNHASIDPNGPYKIILPIEHVAEFTENFTRLPISDKNWLHYTIKPGDTLIAIAKKFDITPDSLRRINTLATNHLKIGQQLLIPDTQSIVADNDVNQLNTALIKITDPYTMQPGDTLYMARKGDNLADIANHFHLSLNALLIANNLKQSKIIHEGEQFVIPTHHAITHQKYQLTPGDTIYMVREGDTLDKIATKFNTATPLIRIANLMQNSHIEPGDRLIIPTHPA